MTENIFREVSHWLHQRGQTVAFSRLSSCKRWNLSSISFEKPAVLRTANGRCALKFVANLVIVDDKVYNAYLGGKKCKAELSGTRIRIYNCQNLRICGNIQQLCSIGDMTDLHKIFYKNNDVNIPLILDTKNVKILDYAFEFSNYNHPLFWNLKNVVSTYYMFYSSKYNSPIHWHTPRLEYTVKMFENSVFNSPIKISTNSLRITDRMFLFAQDFDQEIVWDIPFLESAYRMFSLKEGTKRILCVIPARANIKCLFDKYWF